MAFTYRVECVCKRDEKKEAFEVRLFWLRKKRSKVVVFSPLSLSLSLFLLLLLLRLHARRAVAPGAASRVIEILDLDDRGRGDALEDQLRDAVSGFHCFC